MYQMHPGNHVDRSNSQSLYLSATTGDIFVNFRTAIFDSEGDIVSSQSRVAFTYLKGWFVIDMVSCLPLNYLEYLQEDGDADEMRSNRMTRMLKNARLTKLLKLLRLARVKRLLDRWEEDLYSVAVSSDQRLEQNLSFGTNKSFHAGVQNGQASHCCLWCLSLASMCVVLPW